MYKGQTLEAVTSFKYLGADEGSKPEAFSRIEQASDKDEAKMERNQHFSLIKGETEAVSCHIHFFICQ